MANVCTYLNFQDCTEQAFEFYKKAFDGRYIGEIKRFGELPSFGDMPPLSEEYKNRIVHIELEIPGGHVLRGTDALASFGFNVTFGNNIYICVNTDSREQTDRFFTALAAGGSISQELQDQYWGAYYGACTDKFGVQWVFNYMKSLA